MKFTKLILVALFATTSVSLVTPTVQADPGQKVATTWADFWAARAITINPYKIYEWCAQHPFVLAGTAVMGTASLFLGALWYKNKRLDYAANAQQVLKLVQDLKTQHIDKNNQTLGPHLKDLLELKAKNTGKEAFKIAKNIINLAEGNGQGDDYQTLYNKLHHILLKN